MANKKYLGIDYLIPIYGYIKYTLPGSLKNKNYISIIENTALYFILGIVIAINPFHAKLDTLSGIAFIAVLILEGTFYAIGGQYILRKLGLITKKTKMIAKGKIAFLSYLVLQMHMLAFLVAGFVIVMIFNIF